MKKCAAQIRELPRHAPSATRQRPREKGYILLTLLLVVALMAVLAMGVIVPLQFKYQRDQETEMIHRGVQYSRAIRNYYKKFSRYPTKLEDLDNTNNMRYLRKHYKDPLNCKNGKCQDFRLLHYGEPGVTLGGGFSIGGGSIPGASAVGSPGGQNSFGGSSSSFGNSGFGGSGSGSSGFGGSSFGRFGVRAVRDSEIPELTVPAFFRSRMDREEARAAGWEQAPTRRLARISRERVSRAQIPLKLARLRESRGTRTPADSSSSSAARSLVWRASAKKTRFANTTTRRNITSGSFSMTPPPTAAESSPRLISQGWQSLGFGTPGLNGAQPAAGTNSSPFGNSSGSSFGNSNGSSFGQSSSFGNSGSSSSPSQPPANPPQQQ